MRILITGSNGFVGQFIVKKYMDDYSHSIIATGRGENRLPYSNNSRFHFETMDITNRARVNELVAKHKPDVIIHSAAMSQSDQCELQKSDCDSINIEGTLNVVEAAKRVNAYVLFLSSDFVFDGHNGPYVETDQVNPISHYGLSKVAAEKLIMNSGLDYSIARLCLVYGKAFAGESRNVIMWVKDNLEKRKKIQVVGDQLRTPTFVVDAARGITTLAERKLTGIYHISGAELRSPHDLAMETADFLGLNKDKITMVDSSAFVQSAKRPQKTGFMIDKAHRDLDFEPMNIEMALEKMFGKVPVQQA